MYFNNELVLYSVIGKNVKHYRELANMTQIQLCELTGISISYLSKIEAPNCDKSISLALLNQLANALNVEISLFFSKI